MDKDGIIRIACVLPGHEDDWIEYDTGQWTLADYRRMFYANKAQSLRLWTEQDSTNWHLTGDDGTVIPHPGRGAAPSSRWMAAYEQLGQEGFVLLDWLAVSCWAAMGRKMEVDKKSSAGGAEPGTG